MKDDITASSVANSVRMKRTQNPHAFAIVEGGTDKRAYEVFTAPHACKIEIAHGKANLIAALETLQNDGVQGIIGIADADFDRVIGTKPLQDLVLTDLHDLECMMICSDGFARIVSEFGNREKIENFVGSGMSLLERIATESQKVGLVRLASIENSLELRFDGLKFSRFVDQATLVVDEDQLLDSVFNLSRGATVSRSEVLQIIVELQGRSELHSWQLICGHDFVELMAIGFRKALGAEKAIAVAAESLERALRLSYPREAFHRSRMFAAIEAWEDEHSPYAILERPPESII